MSRLAAVFVANIYPFEFILHISYTFCLYRCSSLEQNYKATISKLLGRADPNFLEFYHPKTTRILEPVSVMNVQILPGVCIYFIETFYLFIREGKGGREGETLMCQGSIDLLPLARPQLGDLTCNPGN